MFKKSLKLLRQPLFFSIEGNIGVGKTTLVEQIARESGVHVEPEPVAKNPFLEEFYRDPLRMAFPLQVWMLSQRFHTYVRALDQVRQGQSVVLDRSVWSDWVFARQAQMDGALTDDQWAAYERLAGLVQCTVPALNTPVYLRVSPEECYRRVHQVRRRACESAITLDYLTGLHYRHEELFSTSSNVADPVVLDWSRFGGDGGNGVSAAAAAGQLLLEQLEPVDTAEIARLDFTRVDRQLHLFDQQVHRALETHSTTAAAASSSRTAAEEPCI